MASGERQPDAVKNVLLPGAAVTQAGQIAELAESYECARSRHEADYNRFGNVASEIAEFEDCDQDLYCADHDSQQESRLVSVEARIGIEEGESAENDQRNGVGGPVDQD